MAQMTADQIKKAFAKARAAQTGGDFATAIKGYERLLRAAPHLAEVQFNLGEIYARLGRIADGARHYEAALKLRPGEVAIWKSYLDLASRHPNVDNLAALIKRAGPVVESLPELDFYRGLIKARTDRAAAIALYRAALSKGAPVPRVQSELGMVLEKTGDVDGALAAYDAVLEQDPKSDLALSRKADIVRNLGQFEAARDLARRAIEAKPGVGQLYYSYASIAKMQADDPMLAEMQKVFSRKKSSDPGVPMLGYALAKAMEDVKAHDQVFRYLDVAAKALSKKHPYGAEADREAVQGIRALYDDLLDGRPRETAASQVPRPVFVTGLPRSGTTLVEQILASHSAVAGGGELGLLGSDITGAMERARKMGETSEGFSADLRKAGETYREKLKARFPDDAVVTDKSISTYAWIGMALTALPDAKIILVRRDPRDTALSIYKNLFEEGTHRYSNDLRDIARFMRVFEEQIAYWSAKLPGGFIEVRYEEVVADLETQARRIVDHAALPWEEACLNFHQTKRKVDTLSTTQVRQPLYASSVSGWRRYEAQMQPFIAEYEALGGVL